MALNGAKMAWKWRGNGVEMASNSVIACLACVLGLVLDEMLQEHGSSVSFRIEYHLYYI
jgi:hypothetical protein